MKVNRKEVAEWIRSLGGEPVQLTIKSKRMKVLVGAKRRYR